MPAKQIYIRYRDEIAAKLQDAFADKNVQKVLLLFEGSTDINTGDSWDETCREGTLLHSLNYLPKHNLLSMLVN